MSWKRLSQHRLAVCGLVVLVGIGALVLSAPASPYDPNRTDVAHRFAPPSVIHPLGTDDLGRDELTRLLVGGQISLAIGALAVSLSLTLAVLIGASAGYFGGLFDLFLMRLTEAALAIPQLFILILLVVFFGTSFGTIVLVIGLLRWMPVARIVRASFLQQRDQEYVVAARALGASTGRVMWRHVLPNVLGPVIVAATLGVGGAILAETTLSFLGMGVQLPTPTWGNMLRASQSQMAIAPWMAVAPGAFIFLTILSLNYVGDGLRDALDPRSV